MAINQFEWLLGSVELSSPAPDGWRGKHVLPFWQEPNNDEWGRQLSRYLMHETIHFWQLLSSSYLTQRLVAEWLSFDLFRDTGVLKPVAADLPPFNKPLPGEPFAAFELLECWARFWEIQTRSPAVIIEEEGHVGPPGKPLVTKDPVTGRLSYTQFGFDWLMEHGPDHLAYVRPYRWLLERLKGNSKAAVASFPIVVCAAFATGQPVRFFCRAIDHVEHSANFKDFIALQIPEYSAVNRLWFDVWKSVFNAIQETCLELNLRLGWGINQDHLHTLEVYQQYPLRFEHLQTVLQQIPQVEPQLAPIRDLDFAKVTQVGVLALPGLPLLRRILGNYLPPPRIRFANFDWYADSAVPGALGNMDGELSGETVRDIIEPLDDDVAAFREAQMLTREGLV
ncbi:MAG: hypothetical protein L0387_39215 [Acidobacteria bacterium]|nr:hypothetical protein [Acidobacteriota bacterium]